MSVPTGEGWTGRFVTARDGLRLFARVYEPAGSGLEALPAVCLPGLTRNAADFHELALHLARRPDAPRRVLALDYRGRGHSDRDPDPAHYDVRVELEDCLDVMTALGSPEGVMVGTSRGGMVTMAMGALRPTAVRGAVLVDIGPVIEVQGLARIKGYVGKLPSPRDWTDAAAILARIGGSTFSAFGPAQWESMARRTWRDQGGALVPDYDVALTRTLADLDLEAPLPTLWPYFEALRHAPVLVVRGEASDLLSRATVEAMRARHPRLTAIEVPGQGHAPLLDGPAVLAAIDALAAEAEASPAAAIAA